MRGVSNGDRLDQCPRIRVTWVVDDLVSLTYFHDFPKYITAIRSDMYLTTDKSWEMKM